MLSPAHSRIFNLDLGRVSRFLFSLLTGSLFLATVSIAQVGALNIRIWQPVLVMLITSIVMRSLLLGKGLKVTISFWPLLLFVLVLLLGILLSGMFPADHSIWMKQSILLLAMLLLFIVIATIDEQVVLRNIATIIVWAGTATCLYAIFEFYINPDELQLYYSDGLLLPRTRGPFAEANEFSQYMTLPFAYVLASLSIGRYSVTLKILFFIALLILVAGQGLSFSRGGILAYISASIPIAFYYLKENPRNRTRKILVSSFIFIIAMPFSILILDPTGSFLSVLFERVSSLFSGSDATTDIRFQGIVKALTYQTSTIWFSIFGIGFGNLPFVLEPTIATTANFVIDIYVEAGVLAVVSVIFLVLYLLVNTFRQLNRYAFMLDPALKISYIGTLAAFCGLLSGGLTYATHMLNIFWLIAGLLLAHICHIRRCIYIHSLNT